MRRLAIFGLDGARLDVIKRWIKEGHLPTFKKMIEQGASGDLRTVLPGPHSFPAWASFATGKMPGKHGIPFPVIPDFKEKKLKFIDSSSIVDKTIWDHLSDNGYTVGVMDLPILYPVKKVNGIMVSSWGTPALESQYTYPPEIKKTMDGFDAGEIPNCYERTQKALQNLYEGTDKKFRSIEWFFDNYEWDFFVNEFIGTELLHHMYSPFLDPANHQYDPGFEKIVRDYYIKLDSFFDKVISERKGVNIILMSDHGFGPSREYIYINNVLEQKGFFFKQNDMADHKHKIYHKAMKFLTSVFLNIPTPIKNRLIMIVPDAIIKKAKHNKTINMDWDRSLAMGQQMGMVYINEECALIKENKITPHQARLRVFESLKNDPFLKDKLKGIYMKEELFGKNCPKTLPDIVIDLKEEYKVNTATPSDRLTEPIDNVMSSIHTMEALFIAYGPEFRNGIDLDGMNITDIAPTVLKFFGIDAPEDMDGKAIEGLFKQDIAPDLNKERRLLDKGIKDLKI